jgi:hypothetical protein
MSYLSCSLAHVQPVVFDDPWLVQEPTLTIQLDKV